MKPFVFGATCFLPCSAPIAPPAEEPGCPGGAWKKLQGPEAGPAHRETGFHYWIAWKIVFTVHAGVVGMVRGRYPAVDG
jgi:hypothetical protein